MKLHLTVRWLVCAIALGACADSPPRPKLGSVSVASYAYPGGGSGAGAIAGFYAHPDPCATVESLGSCELVECLSDDGGAYADAGTVTIAGGRELISLPSGPGGAYGTFNSQKALWAGGETLTFSATGAQVPAFSSTVVAPTQIQLLSVPLTQPSPTDVYPTVEKSQDFTVTWGPQSFGLVEIELMDPDLQQKLHCTFDPLAGTGTIPSATLAKMRTNLAWLSIGSAGAKAVDAGDWSVNLHAGYEATWPGDVGRNGGEVWLH